MPFSMFAKQGLIVIPYYNMGNNWLFVSLIWPSATGNCAPDKALQNIGLYPAGWSFA